MEAWDDDGADVDRLMNRIITGILHHPAQRDMGEDGARDGRKIMFRSVEEWWGQLDDGAKDEFRQKLSRDGVQNGENHKEGVHDTGHGCGGHLGMQKNFAKGGTMEDRIAGAAAGAIVEGLTGGISDIVKTQSGGQVNLPSFGGQESSSSGGGGLLGALGSSLLGGAFKSNETESYGSRREEDDGSYKESRTEYGRSGDRYGQADYSETRRSGGGETREYRRQEQDNDTGRGYDYEERTESRPNYGGGYEERTERRYERTDDSYQESSSGYNRGGEARGYEDNSYGGGRREESYGGGGGGGYERREESSGGYGREERSGGRDESYGGGDGYERREERRDDRRDDGGGGFMDTIADRVGEVLDEDDDNRRRRDDGGSRWGF